MVTVTGKGPHPRDTKDFKATSSSIPTLWLLDIPEFNMSQIQHDHSPFFLHDVHYHWNGTLGPWPVQYGVLERLTVSS